MATQQSVSQSFIVGGPDLGCFVKHERAAAAELKCLVGGQLRGLDHRGREAALGLRRGRRRLGRRQTFRR